MLFLLDSCWLRVGIAQFHKQLRLLALQSGELWLAVVSAKLLLSWGSSTPMAASALLDDKKLLCFATAMS